MSPYLLTHTIQEAALHAPDKEAFRFGKTSLTYSQLYHKAKQLANLLIEEGVQRGDRVGICLQRNLETAISVYGIMLAGAAYVPIDPFAPAQRIKFVLEDCAIRHLIIGRTQRKLIEAVLQESSGIEVLIGIQGDYSTRCISWEEVYTSDSTHPDVLVLEKDLAYVMYTSGSTGTPKGIMHTHFSGMSYAKLAADLYGLNQGDIVGNHCALHYDISTFGYFAAPLVQATTVIVSDAHTKLPASLSQLIEKEQISVWYSVPLALVQLVQNGVLEQRDLSALRWVLFGGEPLASKHLSVLMERMPNARFSNVYGPAEVNQCTYYHVPAIPNDDERIPLGTIWGNTEMVILDEQDQEVPEGTVGELMIRTSTMMRGYWNRPDLTERSLYKRNRAPGLDDIFYRTGDLVRIEPDGNLMFLGRKDSQIKIRGYRVELNEVEHTLLAHPEVEEVAVFAVQLNDDIKQIKAVLITKPESVVTEPILKNFSAQQLPEYAVPAQIIITTAIPRSAAGKIDRLFLQQMDLSELKLKHS